MNGRDSIVWLEAHGQRLGLVPKLGGSVAAWQTLRAGAAHNLWRPWDGESEDRYRFASFAMLPWANRISGGGFDHDGVFYEIAPNRSDERYPIHGDGWLQVWRLTQPSASSARLSLNSDRHDGNPYVYDAEQRFDLVAGGLDQSVFLTHRGPTPLPYAIGLHPWFLRTPKTTLEASVKGVWIAGDDPIPIRQETGFEGVPSDWNLSNGISLHGSFVDNAFTGWDGHARIRSPEYGLTLSLTMLPLATPQGSIDPELCLLYRPPHGDAFCFEPVTVPIDAFHLPGRPGLVTLSQGDSLGMRVEWRFELI